MPPNGKSINCCSSRMQVGMQPQTSWHNHWCCQWAQADNSSLLLRAALAAMIYCVFEEMTHILVGHWCYQWGHIFTDTADTANDSAKKPRKVYFLVAGYSFGYKDLNIGVGDCHIRLFLSWDVSLSCHCKVLCVLFVHSPQSMSWCVLGKISFINAP